MVFENEETEHFCSVIKDEKLIRVLEFLVEHHQGKNLEEIKKETHLSPNTIYRYVELGFIDEVGNKYFISPKGSKYLEGLNLKKPEIANSRVLTTFDAPFFNTQNFAVTGSVTHIPNRQFEENLKENPMQALVTYPMDGTRITMEQKSKKPFC
ncbi:MAG: hypothetical protein J4428_05165 [Candidatus Aenigmarchaeota archaeon]|nr:hypothetical protein [Candidatus Aenigmarchaeota archaeon]